MVSSLQYYWWDINWYSLQKHGLTLPLETLKFDSISRSAVYPYKAHVQWSMRNSVYWVSVCNNKKPQITENKKSSPGVHCGNAYQFWSILNHKILIVVKKWIGILHKLVGKGLYGLLLIRKKHIVEQYIYSLTKFFVYTLYICHIQVYVCTYVYVGILWMNIGVGDTLVN